MSARATGLRVAAVVAFLTLGVPDALAQAEFVRGDVNLDGRVTIADAEAWICLLFCDPFVGRCEDAADADDNGRLDVADLVRTLLFAFGRDDASRAIPPPYPQPGLDPTADDLGCARYEIEPPRTSDETLALGRVVASVGELVAIPVRATLEEDAYGFELVVRYDPTRFAPLDLDVLATDERLALALDGTELDNASSAPRSPFVADEVFPELGVVHVGFEVDLVQPRGIRAGERVHVVNLLGRVLPGARLGETIALELVDHELGDGVVLRNEISGEWLGGGNARVVVHLDGGSITVGAAFVRGDANVDGRLDVSDAIDILASLFIGGVVIDCLDSADVNDDAASDLSDAVMLLQFLFLGGVSPAAPFPACGADRSDDSLDCVAYPPCA